MVVECSVRRGTPADAARLAAIGVKTFEDTFGAHNKREDMAAHLAAVFGVAQQSAELVSPGYITLLAFVGDDLGGFAQVRHKAPPDSVRGPMPLELHRFYVDRPWHGCGLAAPLMAAACDAVRELGGSTVWLSVWEHNPRARAFHAKCGFSDVGTADFFVGPDQQTDRILERRLTLP